MKALQKFSDEYLEYCRTLTTEQILQFLEDFRNLHGNAQNDKSELISIRIPQSLLRAFKLQAKAGDVPYQTQIKLLMVAWLTEKG